MNSRIGLPVLALVLSAAAWQVGCSKSDKGGQVAKTATMPSEAALLANSFLPAELDLQKANERVAKARQAVASGMPATAPADQGYYLDLAVLAGGNHRLAGLEEGSVRAGRYVQDRLLQMGFKPKYDKSLPQDDSLYVQDFQVVQPVYNECKLIVKGKEYGLKDGFYPMRPNSLLAPITPAEGLSGRTIWCGRGELGEYSRIPENGIVLLDYDCDKNWLTAFALGARAIIFIGTDTAVANGWRHVNLPANLPRFYVTRRLAESMGWAPASAGRQESFKPPGAEVTIKAACEWKQFTARNVIAMIKGSAPQMQPNGPAETIILDAPLDSLSEVPLLSPGARNAANVAALMRIAGQLRAEKPKRNVFLVFFDGQTLNHAGAREFYGAVFRQAKGVEAAAFQQRQAGDKPGLMEQLAQEREYRQKMLAILNLPDMFDDQARQSDFYNDTIKAIKDASKAMDMEVLDELRPRRLEHREIESKIKSNARKLDKADAGQKAALERENLAYREKLEKDVEPKIFELEVEDLAWNTCERIVSVNHQKKRLELDVNNSQALKDLFKDVSGRDPQKKREKLVKVTPERYGQLLSYVRRMCQTRIAEIDRDMMQAAQGGIIRDAAAGNAEIPPIVLHISVNLGDARRLWTFIQGEDSELLPEDVSGYLQSAFPAIRDIKVQSPQRWPDFDDRTIKGDYKPRLFSPGLFADSTAVARIFAVLNLSAMTVLDRLPRQGQPVDTIENLDIAAVLSQADQFGVFLGAMADSPKLRLTGGRTIQAIYSDIEWQGARASGASVSFFSGGMTDTPAKGVLTTVQRALWDNLSVYKEPLGFQTALVAKTNSNGNFVIPPVSKDPATGLGTSYIISAAFDNSPSALPAASSEQAGRGLISRINHTAVLSGVGSITRRASRIFKCKSMTVVNYGLSRGVLASDVMRAISTSKFPPDRSLACEWENVLALYTPYDTKGFKVFNRAGMVLVNNLNSKEEYQGVGLDNEDPFFHPVSPLVTAHDLRTLDEYRLNMLRENRINQESLEVLIGMAKDMEDDALAWLKGLKPHDDAASRPASAQAASQPAVAYSAAMPAGGQTGTARTAGVDAFFGDIVTSAAYGRRVYTPLTEVLNDLVTAVVLLLLLAIPFAYALERLLIGTPHIYRQIGWFIVFFLLTFAILYLVNPAFKIASTPMIIFLAFAIILLSCLVIFIMVRKLQSEIRKMQGLGMTVHSADVSRLSTMTAAVNMGISTMRRRPLRTMLTAFTVVLLTFTILTFASFGNNWGPKQTYEGPLNGAPHILIRHQLWSPLQGDIQQVLRGRLSDVAAVVPRYWISPTTTEAVEAMKNNTTCDLLLARQDCSSVVAVGAAIGMDPADVAAQPEIKSLLDGKTDLLETDGIFFTKAVCENLHLTDKDIGKAGILLAGNRFTFAGVMKEAMAGFTMLGGQSILPVDYQASAGGSPDTILMAEQHAAKAQKVEVESTQFVSFNLDRTVLIPANKALRMRGTLRSICIYPRSQQDSQTLARQVSSITELPTYVGMQGGVFRFIFTSLTSASGWRDLMVPVLLGGLIIFATMLGSVTDREKEIYTFSSLGLAPPHVASLFFAEASMYAVIGGMGGYLLGQVVARIMGWMSSMGWLSVPTMNYSSTNAIVTILIVMATVLVSTIYPAIKASRSANPGIQRTWRIPKPQAGMYDLVFPFTVSAYDITGVVSFVKEHFDNLNDTSLGCFATTSCHIFRQKLNDMLGFRANVALAPFDLGVNQDFAMLSRPSDIEGIDEVRVLIFRLSGANGDWQRSNRMFIHDLRKQLLIWRSLPHEVQEKYRQKTMEAWESLSREQVDPEAIFGQYAQQDGEAK
ncbi:MAG: M28 family peptidase [Planctomycetes bacterium]|nr:M28 family peptidase [Planctomycetota bacterium]